jgi:hypothetical protein
MLPSWWIKHLLFGSLHSRLVLLIGGGVGRAGRGSSRGEGEQLGD